MKLRKNHVCQSKIFKQVLMVNEIYDQVMSQFDAANWFYAKVKGNTLHINNNNVM